MSGAARTVNGLCLISLALVVSACEYMSAPVPVGSTDEAIFDERLLGVWKWLDEPERPYFTVARGPGRTYRVFVHESHGVASEQRAWIVDVKGRKFLNMGPHANDHYFVSLMSHSDGLVAIWPVTPEASLRAAAAGLSLRAYVERYDVTSVPKLIEAGVVDSVRIRFMKFRN